MGYLQSVVWLRGVGIAIMLGGCSSVGAVEVTGLPADVRCARDPDATVLRSGAILDICGLINGRLVAHLPENYAGLTEVRIRSAGGDEFAATSISEILNDLALPLKLDGLCASTCISLFILTNEIVVSDSALFLAHSSLRGRLDMISRSTTWRDHTDLGLDASVIVTAMGLIDALMESGSVDMRAYAIETTAAIGPLCAGGVVGDRLLLSSPAGVLYFEGEFDYWLPTEATLIRWRQGRPTLGLEAQYDTQLRSRIGHNLYAVVGANLRPLLADSELLVARAWFEAQSEFQLCT
jgi:hypothetical protein